MKIGYARVSTQEQKLAAQIELLQQAGCEKIYKEKKSGATKERPAFLQLMEHLRTGDTVVVLKLDRLGRSLKDLISILEDIKERGAHFKSLEDNLDTSTSMGKLLFQLFGAFAEYERSIIRERTRIGLDSARRQGRIGGRKKGLTKKAQDKAIIAERLYKQDELSIEAICERIEVSKPTFYKYLRHQGVTVRGYGK